MTVLLQNNRTCSRYSIRILLVCTVFVFPMQLFAQVRRNMEIIDSLMRHSTQQVQKYIIEHPDITATNDTLRVHVVQHSAQWLIEQYLFALPIALRRLHRIDSLPKYHFLTIRPVDCGVRYFNLENNDEMLTREIQILLTLSAEKPTGIVTKLPNISALYRDSINRSAIPFIETQHHEFTRGIVPEVPGTLFRSLLEPIIVVASAAVVLLLLFTVRSQ